MSPELQNTLVWLIVAAAVGLLAYRLLRPFLSRKAKLGCGTGDCGGCAQPDRTATAVDRAAGPQAVNDARGNPRAKRALRVFSFQDSVFSK
ncbi:MAG: FeoB-associated Cys-rich membrane protein [Pirellulales bacterium]